MASEIIYNPDNVWQGKNVLSDVAHTADMIAKVIKYGKEEIMASGYKGTVDIDLTQMENIRPQISEIARDIEYAECQIKDYSISPNRFYYRNAGKNQYKKVWYQIEYNGTYYSSAILGAQQASKQYEKCIEEKDNLAEKITAGEATDREIERFEYLRDKQLKKLETQAIVLENITSERATSNGSALYRRHEGDVSYEAKDIENIRIALNREKSD